MFSITLLTLVAWARHARAVMVNMRRFGIADLRLRPQLKTVTLPQPSNQTDTPTHRHTDTASVAAYEQMFPGGTVDRSHWDHIEASARPHVFMCAVFSLCSLYVFGLKNTLGIGGVVFFSPSDCLFLHSSALSRR